MVNYRCMELKNIRIQDKITQKEAANLIGVPYRTYIRYEANPSYEKSYTYRKMVVQIVLHRQRSGS